MQKHPSDRYLQPSLRLIRHNAVLYASGLKTASEKLYTKATYFSNHKLLNAMTHRKNHHHDNAGHDLLIQP